MEKAFIITKDSEYSKELDEYIDLSNQQKKFINKYFAENSIEATTYHMSGNGGVNSCFDDYEKHEISLSIEPTENDSIRFLGMLRKKNEYGLCKFKKNSSLLKDFAQRCIDEKVVINLWQPRISDYFKSIRYRGCGMTRFVLNDIMYMKIDSDYLDDKEVPDGFIEIKLSEFYIKLEEHQAEVKGNE